MSFRILVKDISLAFKNGDSVELVPDGFVLSDVEDYQQWIINNEPDDWPNKFYIVNITDSDMDGTEMEVQYLLAPYDAFDHDPPYHRRYNVQFTGQYLTDVETNHEVSMDWTTFETYVIDRLS